MSCQKLSEGRIAELKEAFDVFDQNGDGTISSKELGEVMQNLGVNPTAEELQNMIKEVDKDGSGSIEFSEFVNMMNQKDQDVEAELREAFTAFDKDGNGFITADELTKVMAEVGCSKKNVDAMIKAADTNGDGLINYNEFIEMMRK